MAQYAPYVHLDNFREIREKLVELRGLRGMSQDQVAEMLGYSQCSIQRIEKGTIENIMMATLERWITALGGRIEYRITIADRPTRVDHRAVKRELRDAQRLNPKTSAGARRQALSRSRSHTR